MVCTNCGSKLEKKFGKIWSKNKCDLVTYYECTKCTYRTWKTEEPDNKTIN